VTILLVSVLFMGCAQEGKPTIGKPEVREISHEWGKVTTSTTEIITKVVVYNPNLVPIPLKDILTEIYMNNVKNG